MYAVAPRTSSSAEESDYNDLLKRLRLLILRCGHTALINYVDRKLSAQCTSLSKCLANEKTTFDRVKSYGIITPEQYDVLYSSSGTVSISYLDLTLIMCLVRYLECFKLNRTFYWNILPGKGETSIEADICRLMHHMNKLFQEKSKHHDLTTMWEEIERILLRINTVYPMAGFKQTIAYIRYCPLKKIEPVYDELDGFRGGPIPVLSVSGGDIIGSSLKHFGTIGPFVRLLESGEKCFLTAGFVFPGSEINGLKVYAGRYTDICGEVITNGEEVKKETDAALQKIVDDDLFPGSQMNAYFFPKDAALVKIYEDVISEYLICKDTDDLSRAGLQNPYKMRGTCDLRKLNPETYMKRKIVVRCDLSLIIGNLNSERSFVLDAESPIIPYAIAGSAVFLVEDIHTLSCIGIVIGTVAEKTYFFTSIQDNLEKLSHSLGQSVVIQPFDNTTPPTDHGTLSEDSEDSEDISSFQERVPENTDATYKGPIVSINLVNQDELDKLFESHDRKDKYVVQCCESICNMIKSSSEYIIHVYAAYKKENEKKIFFVVTVMWDFDLHEHEIGYRMVKRNYGDLSTEGIDINSSIKESEQKMSDDERKKLNASMSKYAEKLMDNHRYLNVISGSIVRSKNYKPSAMCLSKESCMALYVLVKGFIPIEEDAFQETYDGVSVDIREGLFFPYGMAGEYHDDIKMGCKITRLTEMDHVLGGTLGGFIEHQKYGLCGITCAHALMFPGELKKCVEQNGEISWPQIFSNDTVCQPNPFPFEKNKIGRIVQAIYREGDQSEAGVDIAVIQIEDRPPKSGAFPNVRLNGMKVPYTYETGKTCGITRCMKKDLYKFGCTSDLTVGRIKTTPIYVRTFDFESNGFTIRLLNQLEIETEKFATHGDSGSLVFCEGMSGDFECIGMVEGGVSYKTCVITPIQSILAALKVSSLKNFKAESRFDAIERKLDSIYSKLEQLIPNP